MQNRPNDSEQNPRIIGEDQLNRANGRKAENEDKKPEVKRVLRKNVYYKDLNYGTDQSKTKKENHGVAQKEKSPLSDRKALEEFIGFRRGVQTPKKRELVRSKRVLEESEENKGIESLVKLQPRGNSKAIRWTPVKEKFSL